MQFTSENIYSTADVSPIELSQTEGDYTKVLERFGANYEAITPNLHVGSVTRAQGWILHISVVISQVASILEILVPLLIEENVPFKIPSDKDIASNLLNGNMGINQLGKIISIYPHDDQQACYFAKKLVQLTKPFTGPMIPTDRYLGGVVYTRYGSFSPIFDEDDKGNKIKYIYDPAGNIIIDPYTIPFQLPNGITWPFGELAPSTIAPRNRILKHTYMPLFFMKRDTKGNVLKSLYRKGVLGFSYCLIKQGNKNALSEDNGRTIRDRLIWQFQLQQELAPSIPLPRVIDFFQENEDSYLVMEFIKGDSLYDLMNKVNFNIKSWRQTARLKRLELLDHLINLISVISLLHQKGYVHRDMAPGNFLINRKNQIVLIDLELAFSIEKGLPNPPFEHGTNGFISIQQQTGLTPTIRDDIFGLGALLSACVTGLSPVKLGTLDHELLVRNLHFFTGDKNLSSLIANCLHKDPECRPGLDVIQSNLEKYRQDLVVSKVPENFPDISSDTSLDHLRETVETAINGLNKPPLVVLDDLWYSKYQIDHSVAEHTQKEYIRLGGLHQGIGGVLYLLARAKIKGFNIEACATSYNKGWEFITETYLKSLPNIAPGFYSGAAGIALSMAQGISSGLVKHNEYNRCLIQQCLDLPITSLDLATGITGQGVSLLQCASYLDTNFVENKLEQIINVLLVSQQKDGAWILNTNSAIEPAKKQVSFRYGIPGIIWFLLEYYSRYKNSQAKEAVTNGLNWLQSNSRSFKRPFYKRTLKKLIFGGELGEERKGIILAFIKAYETLQEPYYREIAEEALSKYPPLIIRNDFSQDSGLAGIGELYLEAFRVFKNKAWSQRAAWIANVFAHTLSKNPNGSGFWMMEERNQPTADLMVGNSGIIHFLLRHLSPEDVGYRLLK